MAKYQIKTRFECVWRIIVVEKCHCQKPNLPWINLKDYQFHNILRQNFTIQEI